MKTTLKSFLIESQNLEQLAKEYIKEMKVGDASHKEFGTDFEIICTEAGNCSMVSEHFDLWLDDKGITGQLVVGIIAKNPAWAKRAGVKPGSDEDAHTVTRVGNKIVDFTARQFDKNLEFPRIISFDKFKSEWKHIDESSRISPF